MEREIYTPPEGNPPVNQELFTLFDKVGEEKLRTLVKLFYEEIPHTSIIGMFPDDLSESEKKAADFMVQVTGGPQYYTHNYQKPKMRQQHFDFEIDEKARRAWLGAYKKALGKSDIDERSKEIIWEYLNSFSTWMVNKKD